MAFVRCRSRYSIGSGFAAVPALVDRAEALGLPSLLLADRETLAGQPALHARAADRRLRAISGLEVPLTSGQLVLVARDTHGYETLCEVVSRRRGGRAHMEAPAGSLEPEAMLSFLPNGAPGLVLMTAEPAVARALLARRDLDRRHLRLLLTRPTASAARERSLAGMALAEGLTLLADPVALLVSEADRDAAHLAGRILSGSGTMDAPSALPGIRTLERLFADAPEALVASRALVEQCVLELAPGPPILPVPRVPPGTSPERWLRELSSRALADARARGASSGQVYDVRLEAELMTIERAGLASYFLLAREIAALASSHDVPVMLRGSAAASLLAHLFGLTRVDPVAADLMFERFLNEERRDVPDMDLDVCAERRPLLLEALFDAFGRDRVAQIASYQTLGRTSAVSRGLEGLGADAREAAEIERALPPLDLRAELSAAEWREALARALERTPYASSVAKLDALVGLPSHLSVHPGGVVFGDRPLGRSAPLERAPKGVPVLQYDLEAASWLGFVKVDILGNRGLTQIRATVDAVRRAGPTHGVRARIAREGLDAARADDRDTLALLRSADTLGCVQIETPPMRELLAGLSIEGAGDLVTALALVRPGPGSSTRSRHQPKRGDAGELVYEDDVVRAIADSMGISLARADAFRAELVTCDGDADALGVLERRFMSAAHRMDSDAARSRWVAVRSFAAYAFNKAHAASYAHLAWQCAFLRAHAPAEFAAAVLDHYGGSYPLRSVAAAFARSGLRIVPPHVSESDSSSRVDERGAVRLGLRHVKGLTARTGSRLLACRSSAPFGSLDDFVARVRPAGAELEALAMSGALDGLAPLDGAAYPLPHLKAAANGSAQMRLDLGDPEPRPSAPASERDRLLLRIRSELRYLEMHPSAHPMAVLRPDARSVGAATAVETAETALGRPVTFVGVLAASRRLRVGRGTMHFLTLEDETGLLEVVLTPGVERLVRERLTTPGPYLIEGVRKAGGLPRVRASAVRPFHLRRGAAYRSDGGSADGAVSSR